MIGLVPLRSLQWEFEDSRRHHQDGLVMWRERCLVCRSWFDVRSNLSSCPFCHTRRGRFEQLLEDDVV